MHPKRRCKHGINIDGVANCFGCVQEQIKLNEMMQNDPDYWIRNGFLLTQARCPDCETRLDWSSKHVEGCPYPAQQARLAQGVPLFEGTAAEMAPAPPWWKRIEIAIRSGLGI